MASITFTNPLCLHSTCHNNQAYLVSFTHQAHPYVTINKCINSHVFNTHTFNWFLLVSIVFCRIIRSKRRILSINGSF
ncbi:hypothetical protein PRUPE_8G029700 [Prunus persica]|uniref:Uncharacterized protein n=1 Tax=Prunus persica TaxID=3760 RepID=A0A251MS18_PRUPE|nr:hypothetical protein PRUPE_8G029700 [Prunus persica]